MVWFFCYVYRQTAEFTNFQGIIKKGEGKKNIRKTNQEKQIKKNYGKPTVEKVEDEW
jgi:hypothetical protein